MKNLGSTTSIVTAIRQDPQLLCDKEFVRRLAFREIEDPQLTSELISLLATVEPTLRAPIQYILQEQSNFSYLNSLELLNLLRTKSEEILSVAISCAPVAEPISHRFVRAMTKLFYHANTCVAQGAALWLSHVPDRELIQGLTACGRVISYGKDFPDVKKISEFRLARVKILSTFFNPNPSLIGGQSQIGEDRHDSRTQVLLNLRFAFNDNLEWLDSALVSSDPVTRLLAVKAADNPASGYFSKVRTMSEDADSVIRDYVNRIIELRRIRAAPSANASQD